MGLGDKTVIPAIFLGVVFELTYTTVTGVRTVNVQYVHAAKIMGIRGTSLFPRVVLPVYLVSIMPPM
jgi:ABC-type nitrate/sulfonate/bicarbonate transport system permease component